MKRLCLLIVCVWLGVGSGSAQAQFWNPFRKAPPPPPPAERVSQLVATIKGDTDERKRTLAVEELREFDTKAFPEIVPILADVAQTDRQAGVRAEAVSSLVRIRPVTPIAGQAIEYAAAKDDNWRNRMNAQAALVRYRLAGYSPTAATVRNDAKPPAVGPLNQSQEPPLAERPPIIYHDQYGKVIPAPKNMPAQFVPGTPTSNPNGNTRSPFFPIGPANPAPSVTTPAVPIPKALPTAPAAVEPVFRNINPQPTIPEPGPFVLTPPPASAPIPSAVPTGSPVGPSLDLPPIPQSGPSLEPSSSRMELSPRLMPAGSPMP